MQKLRIDAALFGIDAAFGPLKDKHKAGLTQLLAALGADDAVTDLRWAAYMLATVYHECAGTWLPIEEYGKGTGHKYGVPDPESHQTYYGRGYVQLTWKGNYQTMGQALGIDLVNHPELALQPVTAYAIMSRGMRRGSFTGKRLGMYINDDGCDYVDARKIINGLDCAAKIAGYAERLANILAGSVEAETKDEG